MVINSIPKELFLLIFPFLIFSPAANAVQASLSSSCLFPSQASHGSSNLTVNQLEDIVEDKVLATGVTGELESLCVVHGALFFIDL